VAQVGHAGQRGELELLLRGVLMLRSRRCSRGSTSVIATPSRPARPVRPMRCT
jgi:hypothetical protein